MLKDFFSNCNISSKHKLLNHLVCFTNLIHSYTYNIKLTSHDYSNNLKKDNVMCSPTKIAESFSEIVGVKHW